MAKNLTQQEKQTINQCIRDVEARTNAELVTVIAQSSDDYRYIPTLWAAVLALSFPGVLALLNTSLPYAYPIQIGIFLLSALLFQWTPIKLSLVPRYIKHQRASQHAHELFFIEGLHLTEENTGVMLFVSLDEKYAEIIADQGINQKVDQATWQSIVDEFIQTIRSGQTAQAYLDSIKACGELLQQHYPAKDKNPNELPDHLIEV